MKRLVQVCSTRLDSVTHRNIFFFITSAEHSYNALASVPGRFFSIITASKKNMAIPWQLSKTNSPESNNAHAQLLTAILDCTVLKVSLSRGYLIHETGEFS